MENTRRRSLLPVLLIAVGVLVLVAVLVGVFLLPGDDQSSLPEASNPDIPLSQISRVDVATARNALDAGQAVIVDVRDRVYYDEMHAAGAISIPLSEIEARLGELDPDDWIILYCT